MTICIAAPCDLADGWKIVLCNDTKWSSSVGSTETARKQHRLNHNWWALTAGDEPDIQALLRLYTQEFSDKANLTAEKIDATIKAPLHKRKAELAEEYTRRNFVMSHADFQQHGKERLPPEIFYDATQKIRAFTLNAELIIAGFIDGEPEIYYTDVYGEARASSNFAVVGEAEQVARSALLRRQHDNWGPLNKTLYNVYEAKALSETVNSVGKGMLISVIFPNKDRELISLECEAELKEMFKKYGPQKVSDDIAFKSELYFVTK